VGGGVGQEGLLGGQEVVLGGVLETGLLQLGDLEAQQVDLACPGPLVAAHGRQLDVHGGQLVLGRRQGSEVDTAEPVECRPLHGGGEEALVGVLAMQVDQSDAPLGQCGGRGEVAVQIGPAAPLPGNDPPEDDLLLARPARSAVARGHDEPAGDHGLVGPGPHHARVGPSTHEEVEGGDDHRLAGAGLAGDRRQSRLEDERQFLDDAEIGDLEFEQHADPPRPHPAMGV
jgi:hypothetical protein